MTKRRIPPTGRNRLPNPEVRWSVLPVDGEQHFIFRFPLSGVRGWLNRWLRNHWARYARLEGVVLQMRGTVND